MSWSHGTPHGYSYHKCRCDDCHKAIKEYFAQYRAKNRAKRVEYAKHYYAAHKQELKTLNARNYAEKPEYKAARKRWAKENPNRMRELKRKGELNRRARKKDQFVEPIDPQVVFDRDRGICGICNTLVIGKFHIDHIVPLAKGGLHTYGNVQTAHPTCNERKGSKLQEEICQISK